MTAPPDRLAPDVAIVLPPRETFSPHLSGAIALVVHAAMNAPSSYRRVVVGLHCSDPFAGVPFVPISPTIGLGSHTRRYATAIARHGLAARMIEVHNRPEVALRLARLLRPATVSLFLHNDPQGMRGLRSPAERRHAGRQLAGFVCVSRHLAERLEEGSGVTSTVIPNGIDMSWRPDPVPREKLVLFAGRVVADKGADMFVAACAQALPDLPGWRAAMIGADRFAKDSRQTIFTRHLAPQAIAAGVVQHGYLPHADVLDMMARASIVVVPSRWAEPFGMVALEAMACGAGLVCSMRGGLAELADDVGITCNPDDAADIAGAIRHLARDPAELARRGASGRARASMFDSQRIARRLDTYRDLLTIGTPMDHMSA